MVAFISKFDQMKGQLQVKLGQIRSNLKIPKCRTKICLSCTVLTQDSKVIFYVRQLQMLKLHFKDVTSSPLPGFMAIAQPKTTILL